jgi:phage baseplate assembly protein W
MTRLAFPFGAAANGRSAVVADGSPEHVRQMLELLILTNTGERVMRPDLGSGVLQMLFAPGYGSAAHALEAALAATITQQLGHHLELRALSLSFDDERAVLQIRIEYWLIAAHVPGQLTLERGLA